MVSISQWVYSVSAKWKKNCYYHWKFSQRPLSERCIHLPMVFPVPNANNQLKWSGIRVNLVARSRWTPFCIDRMRIESFVVKYSCICPTIIHSRGRQTLLRFLHAFYSCWNEKMVLLGVFSQSQEDFTDSDGIWSGQNESIYTIRPHLTDIEWCCSCSMCCRGSSIQSIQA